MSHTEVQVCEPSIPSFPPSKSNPPEFEPNLSLKPEPAPLSEPNVSSENLLPVGEEVINPNDFFLINHGGKVDVSYHQIEGQPFSEYIRADVQELGHNEYSIQFATLNTKSFQKGDLLIATVYSRATYSNGIGADGELRSVLCFEQSSDPWNKYLFYPMELTDEWKKFSIPFVPKCGHAVGETWLTVQIGASKQIIEIAGVKVENFRDKISLDDLPKPRSTYPGRESDAPWRKAAEERIERIRKGELRVVVKDNEGKPIPNAAVSVKLVKHAFRFGTCARSFILIAKDKAFQRYRQVLTEGLFNIVTLENDLKWKLTLEDNLKWKVRTGTSGPELALGIAKQGLEWLRDKGIPVHGHVLVWPDWTHLPQYMRHYSEQPKRLAEEVQRHIRELVTDVGNSVVQWDVVNELVNHHDLLDILGNEALVDWFTEARSANPSAKLFINDYGILSGGIGNNRHQRDCYEKIITELIEKGAPLGGIGLQSHFGDGLTGIDDILTVLDRFAKFGLPLWATEYDVLTSDMECYADFTRDFYTALFSHSSVEGITMWGFWDGIHWKNCSPMYTEDWTLKPPGEAFRKLILETWNTNERGETDENGIFTTRGFLGEYVIEVGDSVKTVLLEAEGNTSYHYV